MFYLLGIGLASLVGAILPPDLVGFYNGQRISAALILIAAISWYFLLPETHETKTEIHTEKVLPQKADPLPWRIIIPAAFIIFTARFIDRGLLAATVPLWINKLLGNGLSVFTFVIPIATLTGLYNAIKILPGIGSAPALGALSDRLGKRWIVVAGALLAGAIGIWLMSMPIIAVAWIGALIVPVIGAGVETLCPCNYRRPHITRNQRRALGIIYIFADLGFYPRTDDRTRSFRRCHYVPRRSLSRLCSADPCCCGCRINFYCAKNSKTSIYRCLEVFRIDFDGKKV